MWSRALNGTAMVQERTNSSKVFYFWGHCQNEPPEVLSPLVSVFSALSVFQVCVLVSHMLHVWYIYLYLGDFWGKCWLKTQHHGAYGWTAPRRISSWRFAMDSSKSGGWTLGSKKWAGNKGHELTLFRKKNFYKQKTYMCVYNCIIVYICICMLLFTYLNFI